MSTYLDCSDRDDVLSGGSRMIPVRTPAGTFRVWVKPVSYTHLTLPTIYSV